MFSSLIYAKLLDMRNLFKISSKYKPSGDQPQAIEKLVEGIKENYDSQTLLGITGSGKTFTIANVIEQIQKPTKKSLINLFFRRDILRHFLPAVRAFYFQPVKFSKLSYALYEFSQGILIGIRVKDNR